MPLDCLAVYTIAHGIDTVEDHLDNLDSADISPEFVALELPDVDDINDDITSYSQGLIRQSPATGIGWYIVKYASKREYKKTDNTADRRDSEFEAGRQYADQHGIPHDRVDLSYSEVARRYATWPRRLRDTVVLLIGIGLTAAAWLITFLLGLDSLVILVNQGLTLPEIRRAALGLGFAAVLGYGGRLPALFAIGKIGRWFRDTIRDIRDEAMYRQITNLAEERSATEGLLIVGANHFSGVEGLAGQDGVECRQIESPATSRYDGELDGSSPRKMSELTR